MNNYSIPNLSKACRVLKYLASEKRGFTISEIATQLQIPRTSGLRIVSTLVVEGFLHENNKLYYPGSALIGIGLSVLNHVDVRQVALPVLKALTDKIGETSHLAILSDYKSLLLEVYETANPIRVPSRPGGFVALHCSATGKIFLAYLFRNRLKELVAEQTFEKRTVNTITSLDGLRAETQKILEQGYAIDEQEYYDDVRCIAAPVYNAHHEVIAAVGITATASRFTDDRKPLFIQEIKQAANTISRGMGDSEPS